MEYFISEKELFDFQKSYLYKDLPLAYIVYKELVRKNALLDLRTRIHKQLFDKF
ncbi:hypothetical protein [Kingella negevensis]|uniref:hypothetical protein n=1 Tax=Kingella negevensis TaxID=1522312 RepID=UPI000AA9857E|nr:hypothetical protein [Kingella negevensis]